MPIAVYWPYLGHEQSWECCKTACLAFSSSRYCEWVDASVCRVQTGVATVPVGCQGNTNSLATQRPLVLSPNSSNRIKKLEKQNIIAAVTTRWLPLPLCCCDGQHALHNPQAYFVSVAQQNCWTPSYECLSHLWNLQNFNTYPLKSTIHHVFWVSVLP